MSLKKTVPTFRLSLKIRKSHGGTDFQRFSKYMKLTKNNTSKESLVGQNDHSLMLFLTPWF